MGGNVERAILVIVLIVALVGVVGLFTNYNFSATDALEGGDVTGNVVADHSKANYDCNACAGYAPVCAKLNNWYITYNNPCEATCANAEIAIEKPCNAVRKN